MENLESNKVVQNESVQVKTVIDALQVVTNGDRIKNNDQKKQKLYSELRDGQLRSKYGDSIKIPRFFGYLDEPKELEQVAILLQNCRSVERLSDGRCTMPLNFVVATMSNEGHLLDDSNINVPVDGFSSLGLDWFADEFRLLVKSGLLDDSFRDHFKVAQKYNENQTLVKSTSFSNKADAIQAFVAYLGFRQLLVLRDCEQMNANFEIDNDTDKDLLLWLTYIYYNAGPTYGREFVRKHKSKEKLLESFNNPDKVIRENSLRSAPANAFVVMAGSDWLKLSGAVDYKMEDDYW